VGPAYHQPGSSSVTAPSATTAVAGTEVTSPPSTLGMTNGQSTPMMTNPAISEGQLPPDYVGPAYHQPGSSSVTAQLVALAVACTKVTSPPSTLGMTNGQSTPMMTNPSISDGQVQLATDVLASAMSGSIFKNCQVPPNWWGYGMPPDFTANSSGTSQVADTTGKAPMASAPPVSLMTQNP